MTRAGDIMQRDVIVVRADDPLEKVVRLMLDQGLGGVPVVDTNGRLGGLLTENDLIARLIPRRALRWWQVMLRDSETLTDEYRKAVGTTVGEVMTPTPVSVGPGAPLEDIAAVMRAHGVRVVPVLVDGALVGLVSSADMIRDRVVRPERAMASDVELEREMHRRMQQEPWLSTQNILVQAEGGIVSLHGLVDRAERSALVTMARAIPGCRGVDSNLLLRRDVRRRYAV